MSSAARRLGSLGAVALVLAFALAPTRSSAQRARSTDECPGPTPIYRVGHTIETLHVTGSTHGEDRQLEVHVWYPARDQDDCDAAAGFTPGPGGCHAPSSVYSSRLHGRPLPPPWSPLSWSVSGQAFENARIAGGDDRFPVIVFSHGHQDDAIDYAFTLEMLASHGYVVAAPDHLGDTQADALIDAANGLAPKTVIPCLATVSGAAVAPPCLIPSVANSMVDRYHDVEAVLDALPTWFGPRIDMDRVGIMGHSRGTVTSLAVAGGSTAWGFPADPRIKAVMGLAIGVRSITFGANVEDVTVPTWLIAGSLDRNPGPKISGDAFAALNHQNPRRDSLFLVIPNAVHRHFDSTLCAQLQSAGAIAMQASAGPPFADSKAVLDFQTASHIVWSPFSGLAEDYCGPGAFTTPQDIEPLVAPMYAAKGISFDPSHLPTNGLTADAVEAQVVQLAVTFFGQVLNRAEEDARPATDCLPGELKGEATAAPDPTQQDASDAAPSGDDPD